jgi:anti-anti-sigma factor
MTTSTSLIFNFTQRDGVLIIELRGALDSALAMEPVAEAMAQTSAANVVVVFDDIEYINSAGFGGLVRFSDAVEHAQKSLYIVGLKSKVHLVFSAVGAHSILNILPTLKDALERIQSPTKPANP